MINIGVIDCGNRSISLTDAGRDNSIFSTYQGWNWQKQP